jgi:hypothetical protein
MDKLLSIWEDAINNIKNLSTLQQVKPALYLGLALVILVIVVKNVAVGPNRTSRRRATFPDPEKHTGIKAKAPERPPGGAHTIT